MWQKISKAHDRFANAVGYAIGYLMLAFGILALLAIPLSMVWSVFTDFIPSVVAHLKD